MMKRVLLALCVGFLALPASGWAGLGQEINSIALDQHMMRGSVREISFKGYTVEQITGPYKNVVREYVSPKGVIFGVAWEGSMPPDLHQLLGSYFTELQQASRKSIRRGGPFIVRTHDLNFVSGGHMRWYVGRAYDPALVPANVSTEVVR